MRRKVRDHPEAEVRRHTETQRTYGNVFREGAATSSVTESVLSWLTTLEFYSVVGKLLAI